MSRARELSRLGNINVLSGDDINSEVGIASTVPRSTLDVRGEMKVGTAIQAGTAGVITATSFSGALGGNIVASASTFTTGNFTGNVTIGGTLTYEDVTNIDSLGIVTARAGVNVSGGQLAVGVAYSVGAAGVATAAGFVGPLTGNVTGNISGGTVAGSTGTFTGDVDIADKIVHTGDTNTSIRFPGADTITAETGGSERVRITSAGRLGVGDDSPDTALHVKSADNVLATFESTDADSLIEFKDNGTSDSILLGALGGDDLLLRCDAGAIRFYVNNNNEKARISAGGSFGLGTNNPTALLDLRKSETVAYDPTSTSDPTVLMINDGAAGQASIQFQTVSGGTANTGQACLSVFNEAASTKNTCMAFGVRDNSSTAVKEKLRINSSGQVGINTTSTNGGYLGLAVDSSSTNTLATGAVALNLKNTNTTDNSWVSMDFNNSAGGIVGRIGAQFVDTSDKSTDLYFATREDSGSLTERLRINANGDINFYGTAGISSVKWDASANRLILKDNSYAVFGDSADLQIFHDGSHSQILDTGTGNLYIAGNSNVSIDKYSGEEMANFNADGSVQLYFNNSEKFATTNEGVNVSGMMSATAGIAVTGGMWEGAFIKAGKLSDNKTIGISTSNIFYFSTQESTTSTPNIIWNDTYPLSSKMNVGDVVTVTVISNAAAGGYSANWTIDGNAVSEQWNGGSAPSAGGSDGFDIYTLTIVRKATGTGDTGWLMFANVSNFT